MRELAFEILLRLSKALAAAILGLLCWLSAAAFILLVEESPI